MGRFLIATLTTSTGATVRLCEIADGLNIADVVTAYEVETSTGYLAVLGACLSDLCNGTVLPAREVCTKPLGDRGQHAGQSVDAWCKHIQTHCHGWHTETARQFAETVAASYGSAGEGRANAAGLKAHPKKVKSVGMKAWAETEWAQTMERCVDVAML
jgi:hypothetical protein